MDPKVGMDLRKRIKELEAEFAKVLKELNQIIEMETQKRTRLVEIQGAIKEVENMITNKKQGE